MDDDTYDGSTNSENLCDAVPEAGDDTGGHGEAGPLDRTGRESGASGRGDDTTETTDLLLAWSDGDKGARDRLMLRMQDELKDMARGRLVREKRGVTVETLDLVQDLTLRLLNRNSVSWNSGGHFRGTASVMMYHILVDYAKKRKSPKRNRGIKPISLDLAIEVADERADYLIALHDALKELEKIHPEQYQVIVRHYFGGQTRVEIAQDMDIPEIRANRHLRAGRAFLREVMEK